MFSSTCTKVQRLRKIPEQVIVLYTSNSIPLLPGIPISCKYAPHLQALSVKRLRGGFDQVSLFCTTFPSLPPTSPMGFGEAGKICVRRFQEILRGWGRISFPDAEDLGKWGIVPQDTLKSKHLKISGSRPNCKYVSAFNSQC